MRSHWSAVSGARNSRPRNTWSANAVAISSRVQRLVRAALLMRAVSADRNAASDS